MKNPLPQKAFYYIRHGESEWNVLGKFAGGSVDTVLTENGIRQAKEQRIVFEKLSPTPTHIIHSTLSRATDTAKILNIYTKYPMIAEYDLREIEAGEWEGLPSEQVRKNWLDGLHPKNGESLDLLAKRLQKIFTEILLNEEYEIPFISAHGRLLGGMDRLFQIPPRELSIPNCQLMHFVPSHDSTKQYPYDVYVLSIKKGQIHKELADWSQI